MNGDLLAGVQAAAGLAVYGGGPVAGRRAPVAPFRYPHELLAEIAELRAELADLDTVVVTGPALAATAMARTVGVPLLVDALPGPDRLPRTVIVQTGSGPDVRPAFTGLGLTEAEIDRHVVMVDDLFEPGEGPFAARELVPAALAGVDVAELLDQAAAFAADDHPALALATRLAEVRGVVVRSDGTGLEALGPWLEDLLGILPPGRDGLVISYGGALAPGAVPGGGIRPDVAVNGPLGAQFLAWWTAVRQAVHMLRV